MAKAFLTRPYQIKKTFIPIFCLAAFLGCSGLENKVEGTSKDSGGDIAGKADNDPQEDQKDNETLAYNSQSVASPPVEQTIYPEVIGNFVDTKGDETDGNDLEDSGVPAYDAKDEDEGIEPSDDDDEDAGWQDKDVEHSGTDECPRGLYGCVDKEKKRQGLIHCYRGRCVECFTHGQCEIGFICNKPTMSCIKGERPNPKNPCRNSEDCYQYTDKNSNDLPYPLLRCLLKEGEEEGICVECINSCEWGECDRQRNQCYPEKTCEPECPPDRSWYCDKATLTCKQRGVYCDLCLDKSDCVNSDAVCYVPPELEPLGASGKCLRKCSKDNDCIGINESHIPPICYMGLCMCLSD